MVKYVDVKWNKTKHYKYINFSLMNGEEITINRPIHTVKYSDDWYVIKVGDSNIKIHASKICYIEFGPEGENKE